jgi:hypothetical protein
MVMIVTPRSHAPSPSYALPRFLPRQVSQIVIAYLTTVVPFLERMDLEPPTMRGEKGYLFDYVGSTAWLALPMAFFYEFERRMGLGIDADDFRRIAVTLAENAGMEDFSKAAKVLNSQSQIKPR